MSSQTPTVGPVAPWIEMLARVGYAAKAVLYATIGYLAAQAALGRPEGGATDTRGALRAWDGGPFGRGLLLVIGAGLAGYGVWRLVEAVTDPERRGLGAKAVAVRLGLAAGGAFHLVLALAALRLATGHSGGGSGASADRWTARLLDLPAGEALVWIAAAAVAGYGIYQLYRGCTAQLGRHLAVSSVPSAAAGTIIGVSRFGIAARGAVFCLIGVFLARAAARHDPSQAGGVKESLLVLAGIGRWALGLAALGFIAYGVFELLEARYRRIDVA